MRRNRAGRCSCPDSPALVPSHVHLTGQTQRIGKIAALTLRAQVVFKSPVNRILKIVGRHLLHLVHQFRQRGLEVRLSDLGTAHRRHLGIGIHFDAHDISGPGGDFTVADVAPLLIFHGAKF